MNYRSWLFFLFILFLVIYLCLSFHSVVRENMEMKNNGKEKNGAIILLGDSVFKNEDYVEEGNSVYSFLTQQKERNVYNYAVDESTIVDVYNQINQIPIDLNNENTYIFLSIGGNDIFEKFVEKENPTENINATLDAMFSAYKKLVKSIQTKMNKSNIVLLDIYYPYSIKIQPYIPILRNWNTLVENYANDSSNKIKDVLKLSEIITQPSDLVFDIEPSETGGEKISYFILNT